MKSDISSIFLPLMHVFKVLFHVNKINIALKKKKVNVAKLPIIIHTQYLFLQNIRQSSEEGKCNNKQLTGGSGHQVPAASEGHGSQRGEKAPGRLGHENSRTQN